MNWTVPPLIAFLFFPGGLFVIAAGLVYEWVDRKVVARLQNRIGPRFIQPLADMVKLLAKEEITPKGVDRILFYILPVIAVAAALTSALYVPMAGFAPSYSMRGDLIITIYMLSVLTVCMGVAGANTPNRFAWIGATRMLTQMFSYEAPFMLALLGPAIAAGSWQISEINKYAQTHAWDILVFQVFGLAVALIGVMGKLELPPFDAPEAETEIVAGAMTEYSGRGYALFRLGRNIELVIALTLVGTFYLGGIANPLEFLLKTGGLLMIMALLQSLFARLRIDQTVGLWWRLGAILALVNIVVVLVARMKGWHL